ncbi:hypothetical protein IHE45_19G059200 [Dioscorea alata]|uniref:Uncharacterized protein n=1 Tax=Dioscorea alata TaxID=55571 RepID=A0ACB7TYF1_DIOAL|nr:hypothetical protein IHE45_19G059200 [Dioscorea alata]
MPRTRRHITTSSSANSTEDPHHSMGPGTSMRTPQMNAQVEEVATQINAQVEEVGPQMNAQAQEDGPLHQSAAESDEPQLFRGSKRTTRTWDVQIRVGNGELKRKKLHAIDVYSLPPGEKVVVEWNSRNQPVGVCSLNFLATLQVIVRTFLSDMKSGKRFQSSIKIMCGTIL